MMKREETFHKKDMEKKAENLLGNMEGLQKVRGSDPALYNQNIFSLVQDSIRNKSLGIYKFL